MSDYNTSTNSYPYDDAFGRRIKIMRSILERKGTWTEEDRAGDVDALIACGGDINNFKYIIDCLIDLMKERDWLGPNVYKHADEFDRISCSAYWTLYKYWTDDRVTLDYTRNQLEIRSFLFLYPWLPNKAPWKYILNKLLIHVRGNSKNEEMDGELCESNCMLLWVMKHVMAYRSQLVEPPEYVVIEEMFSYICLTLGININEPSHSCPGSCDPLWSIILELIDLQGDMVADKTYDMLLDLILRYGAAHDEMEDLHEVIEWITDPRTSCHNTTLLQPILRYREIRRAHSKAFAPTLAYIACNPDFGATFIDGMNEIFDPSRPHPSDQD